jgi:hypothetical protein
MLLLPDQAIRTPVTDGALAVGLFWKVVKQDN